MTAESGGGESTLNGFGSLTGTTVRYGLRANASRVRTRYSGVSIISSAALALNGTADHSVLNGTVTIDRVALGNTKSYKIQAPSLSSHRRAAAQTRALLKNFTAFRDSARGFNIHVQNNGDRMLLRARRRGFAPP